MSSPDRQEIEVNVVSSPESSSRNASPEPENFRNFHHHAQNITCFPVIKTNSISDDEKSDNTKEAAAKAQKTSGASTNFSISSILSRAEPTVVKKNGLLPANSFLDTTGLGNGHDSAMLSRYNLKSLTNFA